MKKYLVSLLALLLVASIIGISGCSSNSTPAATTQATATTSAPAKTTTTVPPTTQAAQIGGTLRIYLSTDPNSFWPPTMGGQTDGQTSSFALETFFRFDQQGNIVPLLATDWKADATAKTITITLKKGVKFQDGSDFNAEVAKWNLDQYRTSARGELKNVTSVDVVDDQIIRLNLSAFDNTIITNLANCSDATRMISKKSFDANGGKSWAEKNPVGTGAFQMVSWTKTVGITWKRFDGYWGGKPYLDGIEMKEYADPNAAVLDFQANNLDMMSSLSTINAKALGATSLYNIVYPPIGTSYGLIGNPTDPSPFAKLGVRQAMAYAIDTKTICDSYGFGAWQEINQLAIPGSSAYNPSVVGYPYNPAKAKELLAAAGYPSGFNTTLNFWAVNPTYNDIVSFLQNYLKAVGINVTQNSTLRPGYTEWASNGKPWDGIAMEFGNMIPDPLAKYAPMMRGEYWGGMYRPQEVIDTYNLAIAASDTATKQKLTAQLSSLFVDKYCMENYLFVIRAATAKSKNVHDDLYSVVPYSYLSPMTWLSK